MGPSSSEAVVEEVWGNIDINENLKINKIFNKNIKYNNIINNLKYNNIINNLKYNKIINNLKYK